MLLAAAGDSVRSCQDLRRDSPMGDAGDVLLLALQSLAGRVKHSGVHSVLVPAAMPEAPEGALATCLPTAVVEAQVVRREHQRLPCATNAAGGLVPCNRSDGSRSHLLVLDGAASA